MKAEIIYEDRDIIICLKLPGLDSQKDMCSLLEEQLGGEVFCVHRLDREVGGLMVYARSRSAAAALSAAITGKKFVKEYLAAAGAARQSRRGLCRTCFTETRQRTSPMW